MERILVVGNGFNLDLGLNSVGYDHFFLSEEWKSVCQRNTRSKLIKFFLHNVEKKENNIEILLDEYVKNTSCLYCLFFGKRDKTAYNDIETAFQKYVARGVNASRDKIRMDSTAIKVWREFEKEKEKSISDTFDLYSFNYVLLDQVADLINGNNAHWKAPCDLVFPNPITVDYIHGRTDGNRNGGPIILGIAETPKKCFKYMEKKKNQAFMPQKQRYLMDSGVPRKTWT